MVMTKNRKKKMFYTNILVKILLHVFGSNSCIKKKVCSFKLTGSDDQKGISNNDTMNEIADI